MPRAYKLPNAESVFNEIEFAQEFLSNLQGRARGIAASIGSGVTARFRRHVFSDDTSQVILGRQRL